MSENCALKIGIWIFSSIYGVGFCVCKYKAVGFCDI